jgi:hypothetical protein
MSLYSRYNYAPRHRMLLAAASAALIACAAVASGAQRVRDDGSAAALLLAGAGVAVASRMRNPRSVHTGTFGARTWRDFPESTFTHHFRFEKDDMTRLLACLNMPVHGRLDDGAPFIRTKSGYVVSHDAVITQVLYSFTFPKRLHDMHWLFGARPSRVSETAHWFYDWMYDTWYVPLLAGDLQRWAPEFPAWAAAIFEKTGGAGYDNVVGFIDGTWL